MEADGTELENVAAFIERLIAQSKHEEAAFWIGYLGGLKRRLFGGNPLIRSEDINSLQIIGQGQIETFIAAFVCGYFDGFDGKSSRQLIDERNRVTSTEMAKFRRINGCSVCKHAKHRDEIAGMAAERDEAFWCGHFNKAVNWKEGATCAEWACEK